MNETPGARPVFYVSLVAALLLVIAVFPLEYGYYIFLRLAITAAAIWIAIAAGRNSQGGWVAAGVIMALLFNPFIPVWLSKGVWIPIDLAGAVSMVLAGANVRTRRSQSMQAEE